MMDFIKGREGDKSNHSLKGSDKKINRSKTSSASRVIVEGNDERPKSSSSLPLKKKVNTRVRSKTTERCVLSENSAISIDEPDLSKKTKKKPPDKKEKRKSEINVTKKLSEAPTDTVSSKKSRSSSVDLNTRSSISQHSDSADKDSKTLNSSAKKNCLVKIKKNSSSCLNVCEVSKTKVCSKASQENTKSSLSYGKIHKKPSKPILSTTEFNSIRSPDAVKIDDKMTAMLAEDFAPTANVCKQELKQLATVWYNTVYCTLSIRSNLVQLLFKTIPNINRDHFELENNKILNRFLNAQTTFKAETESLLDLLQSVLDNRELLKQQYKRHLKNQTVAEAFNNDWKKLSQRIKEAGEKTKVFQNEAAKLQKQKEDAEQQTKKRIHDLENSVAQKTEEIKKLEQHFAILKEREAAFANNSMCKTYNIDNTKNEMKSIEKEYNNLKEKLASQNEMQQKEIKDLEILLVDKQKILDMEKQIKQQQLKYLEYMQEKRDNAVGVQTKGGKFKTKNELWVAAVKLLLKGFIIQTKKLERDRNKMLLLLQSDDFENFEAIANTIIKKEHFIKSIKYQMNELKQKGKC